MDHMSSIEILHHFSCKKCSGWWSIATERIMKAKEWYCPWCGHYDHYVTDNLEVENYGESIMGGGIPPKSH